MENYTGKRIDGRYEIQEVIGVGGMAVVYKAYDNIDDRIVAVKILKDEFLANEEFRRRFKNESKAISLLSHPNIVKVYNVSYGVNVQYIVMEYVEGITLKEYIEQQGRLGIKETIHFTMQILRALQHAHDKGIIHRDIKPQNIMLLSNGNIKVTDFGIARFSYSDTKTMTDSAIGSVHYISPEQARGLSIDERTDVYSVGVVMYEMLTGMLPFVSDNSVSVALMQLQNDPKSIREINPTVPVGLEQIVNRAMQKDTKSRYQTASEMLLDIEEFKRNPNIRFQQNFFIDSDPTKFATGRPVEAPRSQPVQQEITVPDDTDDIEESNRYAKKGKGGFIFAGILIGLIVIALGVFGGLYFLTDTFSKSADVVPNFVGLDYESQIKDNTEYQKFNLVVSKITRSGVTDGTVVDQEPGAKTKITNYSTEITIYVVENQQMIPIPDVYSKTCEQAKKILEGKGFKVQTLPTLSTEEFGTVIKTEPARNSEVESGTLITIFYASDEDLIEVPKVIGYDTNMAKLLLESANLNLDPNVKEEPSDRAKGEIISQIPDVGEKVIPGYKISVVVSSGVPASRTCIISMDLPKNDSRGSVEVYVNNNLYKETTVLLDGSEYQLEVEGNGSDTSVKIYVDNKQYFTCMVDFSSSTPTAYDGKYISKPIERKTLPNVVGMTMAQAIETLNASGFDNVKTETKEVLSVSENGMVLSMTPDPNANSSPSIPIIGTLAPDKQYDTDTQITLVVGQKEGV